MLTFIILAGCQTKLLGEVCTVFFRGFAIHTKGWPQSGGREVKHENNFHVNKNKKSLELLYLAGQEWLSLKKGWHTVM